MLIFLSKRGKNPPNNGKSGSMSCSDPTTLNFSFKIALIDSVLLPFTCFNISCLDISFNALALILKSSDILSFFLHT